ncbi:MAG: hypothetical protein RBG1_1C00001G0575 [candidate division Zixibacteria bacterium RBG-1]|nr:MAG: hypothetical protein RBG1_1C00001G0575 [candidate division Zixibacteria bacterium RBG-1]OGC83272.1 MAG: hypothetical protein A2V73_05510 [candidate division Zixibacteria bacterium RBG_19FT_COMBO_42_43]
MRHKTVLIGLGVCLFFLLSNFCFAQFPAQDTGDHGAMDTIYISCTAPDFFEKDSIRVSFDLMVWTDASLPNEYIVGWDRALIMTSSNPGAAAKVIIDERANGPVYKGTAVGVPNDWQARFNSSIPPSGVLPATVIYGAIQDLLPPQNAGPSLFYGRRILAHIIIIVKDTTTIHIDSTSTETASLHWVRNDAVGYEPLWIQSFCPVTPLACLYKPGDANGDGKVDLGDLIFIVNRVYKGGPAPVFECQADLNADKIVTMLDVVVAVNYLFKGGPPPLKSWTCCL